MELEFSGRIWYWRGPSPYLFVTVPQAESSDLRAISSIVSYGWGVIPVQVRIGRTEWKTSLFPKDGLYLVPIKVMVQKAERIGEGDRVSIHMEVRL